MNQEASKANVKSFTDLTTWQEGHRLVLAIYAVTENFPQSESFGLISQMRRAAISITSNIAEGFSRDSIADKKHFYIMAHGSLTELQNQLLIARDIKLIEKAVFADLAKRAIVVHKLLTGLIKVTKQRLDS